MLDGLAEAILHGVAGIVRLAGRFLLEIGKILLQCVAELVLEIGLRGPGYLILRYVFRRRNLSLDDDATLFAGLVFWILLIVPAIGFIRS